MAIWNIGKKQSEETKHKRSLALKGKKFRTYGPLSAETRAKMSLSHIGKIKSEKHRIALSNSLRGKSKSEDHKKALKLNHRGLTGLHHSDKAKEKVSIAQKKIWGNAEYKRKSLERIFSIASPNKSELNLFGLVDKILPNEYKLNTKAEIIVLGGKIPDIVNVNGAKKVIELFGRHVHKPDDEPKRINYFKQLGWDTLIIWYEELKKESKLVNKILEFHSGSLPFSQHIKN